MTPTPQKLEIMIIGGGIGGLVPSAGPAPRRHRCDGLRAHSSPHRLAAGLPHPHQPARQPRRCTTACRPRSGSGSSTPSQPTMALRLRDRTARTTCCASQALRFCPRPAQPMPTTEPAGSALREVLLSDLDDVVRRGKTFERYETGVDGRVTAYFSDGTSATADVLIGADGANSRVRQQLLPDAERIDTGILAIAGKHRPGRSQPATCAARRCQHDHPDRQRLLVHRSVAAGPHDDRRGASSRRLPAGQLDRLHVLGLRRPGQSLPTRQ